MGTNWLGLETMRLAHCPPKRRRSSSSGQASLTDVVREPFALTHFISAGGHAELPILLGILPVVLSGGSSESARLPLLQYNMGEQVPVGRLTYTVFETQWATHFGAGVTARVPQNRFFLFRVNPVNAGSADAPNSEFHHRGPLRPCL